ncbi:hypothetical protein N5C66_05800 [Rhizobium pusense]|uniref:hypothetical protein n=1 Tax=Agrobacterium pusense TaxID=648995 RepID=UPI002446CF5E|nr:hypothetical protein [Agrobacterium pusense]MDH1097411.1 hypothetical protein [Agrobacterium pusense]MDH1111241.1 hypothetical protein [Agrobacterium pusense]MDH2193444.1 hypothetical protein [Agrobacterium pusense]
MAKATRNTPATEAAEQPAAPAVAAPDDDKKDYVVTKTAPARVAGRRVNAGDTLRLSEHEALAEELAQHIRPAGSDEKADAGAEASSDV